MLDVLKLDVHPPYPFEAFFDPDFLERIANPPKKEPLRLPPASGKKTVRQSNLAGLEASAKQAILAELREQAQPEHNAPEAPTAPAVKQKKLKLRKLHDKTAVRPVVAPPKVQARKSTEPKPEPVSLKPRREEAISTTDAALKRLQEVYDGLREEILSVRRQVLVANCKKLPAAEERSEELLKRVRKLQGCAGKKHR